MDIKEKLKQGVAAAQADDKQTARMLLKEVVEADERQVVAWLWLYKVVDSLEEKAICLENVLMLEPGNEYAEERLARIKKQQESLFTSAYPQGEEAPPPSIITEQPDTPITTNYPHKDEFGNELLCPFCLALTQHKDRRCSACRHPLIISKRVKEERTIWLWRGFFFQLVIAFWFLAFGAAFMTLMGKLNGVPSPIPYLPLYFGLPVSSSAQQAQTLLSIFPLWAFWGLIAASIYSFILMVVLYIRFPYGNVLYLISATLFLGMGITVSIFYFDSWTALISGIVAVILGAVQMLITFNLWNDFTFKEGRLILRLDQGVKNAHSLALSGRRYSQLGMWGLTVIHFRGAVGRKPENPIYHVGLITAYLKVKRYDLAEKALAYAEGLSLKSPGLSQLRQQIDSLQKRGVI